MTRLNGRDEDGRNAHGLLTRFVLCIGFCKLILEQASALGDVDGVSSCFFVRFDGARSTSRVPVFSAVPR